MGKRPSQALLTAVLLLLGGMLAACSDSNDSEPAAEPAADTTEASADREDPAETPVSEDAEDDDSAANGDDAPADDGDSDDGGSDDNVDDGSGDVIEVVAVDFAFEGLPDVIDVGSTLTLRNAAATELHELVAFRLPDGEDRSVEEVLELPPPEMQQILGAPTTVILAPPGSEQIATPIGDGTLTEPGRYAFLCLIPTGVDPDEYLTAAATSDGPPDVGDGPPHTVHGMFAEVEVQ